MVRRTLHLKGLSGSWLIILYLESENTSLWIGLQTHSHHTKRTWGSGVKQTLLVPCPRHRASSVPHQLAQRVPGKH
jgi:hypothetical protein